MIGRIEQQLDCTCETYADLRMINKYSVPCRINLRYFPPIFVNNLTAMGIELPKLQVSLFKIRNYTVQFFSFLKDLQDTKLSDQVYLVTHESLSTVSQWALKMGQMITIFLHYFRQSPTSSL